MAQTNVTISEALNAFGNLCMRNRDFRIMCCGRWQDFDDSRIGQEIADYTAEVADQIEWKVAPGQLDAIRAFPPEPLRLLKGFIVQFLGCPNDGKTVLTTRYESSQASRSSITITIDQDNEATVTFKAPTIL